MNCPSCGFETPDSQPWCDFCKEPLSAGGKARKTSAHPEPKPKPGEPGYDPPLMPPPLYAQQKKVDVPMQTERALEAMGNDLNADKVRSGIPPQFSRLDSGARAVPPSLSRKMSWVLIAIACVFLSLYLSKLAACHKAGVPEKWAPRTEHALVPGVPLSPRARLRLFPS